MCVAVNAISRQQDPHVQESIGTICGHAYQYGLSTLTLGATLEIILRSKNLSQAGRSQLIRSLYPVENVPSQLVCNVMAFLGQGGQKLAIPLQQSLLKWFILVYEALEDPSILSKLYNVLFNMLDITGLRYVYSS